MVGRHICLKVCYGDVYSTSLITPILHVVSVLRLQQGHLVFADLNCKTWWSILELT